MGIVSLNLLCVVALTYCMMGSELLSDLIFLVCQQWPTMAIHTQRLNKKPKKKHFTIIKLMSYMPLLWMWYLKNDSAYKIGLLVVHSYKCVSFSIHPYLKQLRPGGRILTLALTLAVRIGVCLCWLTPPHLSQPSLAWNNFSSTRWTSHGTR